MLAPRIAGRELLLAGLRQRQAEEAERRSALLAVEREHLARLDRAGHDLTQSRLVEILFAVRTRKCRHVQSIVLEQPPAALPT